MQCQYHTTTARYREIKKLITNKIANSTASILQKRIVSQLFQMSVLRNTKDHKFVHKSQPQTWPGKSLFLMNSL